MDRQEIRMRCLEAAQLATKTPAVIGAEVIVTWAAKFEAYVTGPDPIFPASTRAAIKKIVEKEVAA